MSSKKTDDASGPVRETGRVTSPNTVAFSVICQGREKELATDEEIAALRAHCKQWKEFAAQMAQVAGDSPREQIRGLTDAYHEKPTRENFEKLREAEMNSQALKERWDVVLKKVKEARRESSRAIVPVCANILRRALAMVEAEAAPLITQDRELAKRYNLPYVPGPVVGAIQNLYDDFHSRVAETEINVGFLTASHLIGDIIPLPD